MKAESVNSPAKQAPGEWETQQVLLGNKCPSHKTRPLTTKDA